VSAPRARGSDFPRERISSQSRPRRRNSIHEVEYRRGGRSALFVVDDWLRPLASTHHRRGRKCFSVLVSCARISASSSSSGVKRVNICTRRRIPRVHPCARVCAHPACARPNVCIGAFVNPTGDLRRFGGGGCPCTWRERPLA